MSTEARLWFDQWREVFLASLDGTASIDEASQTVVEAVIDVADRIATRAVAKIRERAAEADATP